MKKVLMTFAFIFIATSFLFADDGKAGFMYSEYGCYVLRAPKGWTLDGTTTKGTPILAVFYPNGQNFDNAPAVFYTTIMPKNGGNFENTVRSDIDKFKREHPKAKVLKEPDIKNKNSPKVAIYSFTGDKWGNHDRVAYVEMPKMVVIIALQAKNEKAHDKSLSAFVDLITSFEPAANVKAVKQK